MASQIEAKNGKQAMLTDILYITLSFAIRSLFCIMELVYASFDLGQRITDSIT